MPSGIRTENDSAPARHETWKMFDRIAFRYDLLNRLLSFRRDVAWRKRLGRCLPSGTNLRVLDLATGTADVLIALHSGSGKTGKVGNGVGLDMSMNMLTLAKKKVEQRRLGDRLAMLRGDASAIAVKDNVFDAATMAFGIRNVVDVSKALREIHRVLKPEGRGLILEFSLPRSRLFRTLYLFYFRHVLPRVGALISGDRQAYRYLNQSVETFPQGEDFRELMTQAGFTNVQAFPLSLGIATLYQGDK